MYLQISVLRIPNLHLELCNSWNTMKRIAHAQEGQMDGSHCLVPQISGLSCATHVFSHSNCSGHCDDDTHCARFLLHCNAELRWALKCKKYYLLPFERSMDLDVKEIACLDIVYD